MNPSDVPGAILRARAAATEIVSPAAVQRAIDQMSIRLALELQSANPLVLVVMHGGMPYAAELIKRFAFPLEYGYLQVGRYGTATSGGELRWYAEPRQPVAGRTVLLVDDILDRGDTLAALREWARAEGARAVFDSVLVDKRVQQPRTIQTAYAALRCPDRYLFGCGMDYRGYWRNLPGIWALPEDWREEG